MGKNKKILLWAGLLLSSLMISFQTNATEDYWTISIANPENSEEWITIMDRNLWATSTDITSKYSFGYHYQWWNNYWFPQWCFVDWCSDSVTESSINVESGWAIRNDSYNNSWYYWTTFIKAYYVGYREGGNYHNWLRWWIWDNPNNNWWARQTNSEDRQWPCPEGYHVPSAWEWWLLVKYRWNTNAKDNLIEWWDGFYYISWDAASDFNIFFKLPFAGRRWEEDALIHSQWLAGSYWSSSPNGDAYPDKWIWERRIHTFNTYGRLSGIPIWEWNDADNGLSIRCFKNTYEPTNSSSTPQTCASMDSANVTHTIKDWIITLHWEEIQWDFVDVSIYGDEERWYLPEGTVNMKDKKFEYKIKRSGEHKFMLRNWCKNFYYTVNVSTSQAYPQEFQEAYEWAYEKWIISDTSIDNAKLYDSIDSNIELADIMNKFAENILWLQSDTSLVCDFWDLSSYMQWYDEEILNEYQWILTKSCHFWLIPRDKITSPAPIQDVNRATFGTALSRALWWNQNEWWEPYYSGHLNALKKAWIINNIENAEITPEIKWYVLITLKRATEYYENNICKDAVVMLACLDPTADLYNECPKLCRKKTILTNDFTKIVTFPTNEVTRKIVFSWTYTVLEDKVIHWMSIENNDDNNDTDPCYNDIIFYTYINWKETESDYGNIVLNSCWWTHYIRFNNDIEIPEWDSIQIKIEWELNSASFDNNDKEDNYSYKLTFYGTGWNEDKLESENLAPIEIAERNTSFILNWWQEKTVFLKEKNSRLAEFLLKTLEWNSAYLDEIVLEIDQPEIEVDNIRLKIDGTEYEPTSSNNWIITYQPDIEVPSKWVPVQIILKEEPKGDDVTVWINVKSINGKLINQSFSKRFVSALVYISKQEKESDYTKFTLWVETYNENYSVTSVCMLTWSTGAGRCLLGENYANWPFEDWYSFEVMNSDSAQLINYIDYFIEDSERDWWGDSILIKREDYPDYFKIGSWESRKIFSKDSNQCIWMDLANVSHTISWDVITLKWTAIDGNTVQIAIFNPESEVYENLWVISMEDKKFDYKIQRDWQQNFLLTNGCRNFYYKVDVKLSEQYSEEFVNAYNRAYEKWIISETPINNANLYEALTNLELADIMSKFAENVLWIRPNTSLSCTFDDIALLTQSEQDIIIKSCQLWLMPGDKTSKSFNPNDISNRATFGSALSRALRWEQYEWWTPYYSGHLNALKNAAIINQIENAESTPQIKWYTLNTLKLSYDNYSWNSQTYTWENSWTNWWSSSTTWRPSWSSGWGWGWWGGTSKKTDKANTTSLTSENNWVNDKNWNKDGEKTENQIEQKSASKETLGEKIPAQVFVFKSSTYNNWNPSEVLNNWYTREMNNAYQFAHDNWITTTSNIEAAQMNSSLTRIAMAKMLSNYAINILWKRPDTSKWTVKFGDVTDKQNLDYGNAVTLSYQLWIMWQWISNFRPNDEVTRAEFATALSRMLYNTEDWKWNTNYYEPHIAKLYKEWVINNTDSSMKEKRWYVMIMLMRSVK